MCIIRNKINLLKDFGFKRMFGTEPYKKNLISFLNTFIKPYFGPVTDIDYRPPDSSVFCQTRKGLFSTFTAKHKKKTRYLLISTFTNLLICQLANYSPYSQHSVQLQR